jgi:hypothetical protein
MNRLRAAGIILAVFCVLFAAPSARAATPANGTLTPTITSVHYTGGPFANDNQSSPIGETPPVCASDAAPCDDFAATVSIPATDPQGYVLTVRVSWANLGSDFDLYVLDASGNVVGQGGGSSNPEVASFVVPPHQDTTYTVRVVPFAVAHGAGGDTYDGNVTLAAIAAPPPSPPPVAPPPPVPGVPRYQSYVAPPASGLGQDAGEPSLGANWRSGNWMFQAGLETLRVTFSNTCSAFPTTQWVATETPVTSSASFDPILFTDRDTGRTIVSQLTVVGSASTVSDDDGGLWLPSQGAGIPSGIDHQTVGGGPFAPPLNLNPPSPVYPHAVYYCSQDLETAFCAMSPDGGLTYGPGVPIYTTALDDCVGIHGHVKVAPDGTAYVPNRDCGGKQNLTFSTDNGTTWSVSSVPDSSPNGNDPQVGIGAHNTLYFGYADANGHPKVAVGHRNGATISWGPSQDVGTAFAIEQTAFPSVVAGDDDRAAFAFLGSPLQGDLESHDYRGIWHLYVAHTYDGGQTWTTVDATPDDPVQRGCIWLSGGSDICRNLLDFMDVNVDKEGRVGVGFPDGCTGACVNAPVAATGNTYAAVATIARQSGGKRLLAAFDPPEPTLPGAAQVTALRDAAGVHLTWTRPDSGGLPITDYKVYRRADGQAQASVIAHTGTQQSYLDTTAASGGRYFYSVTAVTQAGEAPACGVALSAVEPTAQVGGPCAAGGLQVIADPAGDQQGAPLTNADLDIQSVSVGEPYDAANPAAETLVFTLKVAGDLSQPQPNHAWRVIWDYPVGPGIPDVNFTGSYYAAMTTDNAGQVSFEYGTIAVDSFVLVAVSHPVPIGPATGVYLADGTVRITVPKAFVGQVKAGDLLGNIFARTFLLTGSANNGTAAAMDFTTSGQYLIVGNAACKPPSVTGCLEDDDSHIEYSNGWHLASDAAASAGHFRLHAGNNPNAGAKLGFDVPAGSTGALDYFYATSTKGGSAQVFLDGVARGTVSFNGATGTMQHPTFGGRFSLSGIAAGHHTFELRSLSGVVYLDKLCLTTAATSAQPASGPGPTTSNTDVVAAAGEVVRTVTAPAGTSALAVVAQASTPVRLLVLSTSGSLLGLADSSAGIATVEVPASAGPYLVKVVNLSLGPVQVWSAATPQVAR